MKCHNLPRLVVSAGLLLGTAWADQVVMKNGDRVTPIGSAGQCCAQRRKDPGGYGGPQRYDKFQDLDLRFVIGGGFGFHAVKNKRSVLDVLGGADYNHSSFSTPLTRNAAEAFWGDEYTLKLTGASSLTQSFRMFNNLSDTGAYRVNLDVGVAARIKKWLSWNLALSDRYLNNPVPGRKTTDWLYTTGLGITFAS